MSIKVVRLKRFNSTFENEIQEPPVDNQEYQTDEQDYTEPVKEANTESQDSEFVNETNTDKTVVIETPLSRYVGVIVEDDDDKPYIIIKGRKETVFDMLKNIKISILKATEIVLENIDNRLSVEDAIQKLDELSNDSNDTEGSEGVYLVKRNQIISISL